MVWGAQSFKTQCADYRTTLKLSVNPADNRHSQRRLDHRTMKEGAFMRIMEEALKAHRSAHPG